jgi:hypothetical protein
VEIEVRLVHLAAVVLVCPYVDTQISLNFLLVANALLVVSFEMLAASSALL